MKIAIVVQSNTGNTRQLAEAIQSALPDEMLIYSGAPAPEALQADLIFCRFLDRQRRLRQAGPGFFGPVSSEAAGLVCDLRLWPVGRIFPGDPEAKRRSSSCRQHDLGLLRLPGKNAGNR